MKLNSTSNFEFTNEELVNPVYEEKAISILVKAFIRVVDIIGAIIGILMLIPISIYVLIQRVRTSEKGPLFYTQKRIGKNGKIFRLYKLNTDAPISEFPQFINVLLGQMTLVGPRPYTTEEIPKMGGYYDVIIKSKPGITGVYQISGKTKITFNERLDLDLNYLLNNSLKLNLKILLITIFITSKQDRKELYEQVMYSEAPTQNLTDYLLNSITLFIKRIADIIGSLIGIVLLIPLIIIVELINIIMRENGPLFYCHERIGKNGKHFKMYKFRSMVVNADEKLKEMLENDEELRKEFEETRKLKKDPRITKIGKILRKTSLDEFPQFINVLKGEMSLVGPRAVVDDEIELFGDKKDKFLSVKPGITGYWAANGRSNTTYEERVEMEVYYAEHMSILLDIKILFKTILSVIKEEGAV
jgi:lipopolysaccharide/colanic/teichoic acid biosynthesis glycosyltransferase